MADFYWLDVLSTSLRRRFNFMWFPHWTTLTLRKLRKRAYFYFFFSLFFFEIKKNNVLFYSQHLSFTLNVNMNRLKLPQSMGSMDFHSRDFCHFFCCCWFVFGLVGCKQLLSHRIMFANWCRSLCVLLNFSVFFSLLFCSCNCRIKWIGL